MPSEIKVVNLGGVNCYLFKAKGSYLLVDTGFSNKRTALETELKSAGCQPGNLNLIVLTHGDSDHVGNGAYLHAKYGAPIAMHRSELEAIQKGDPALNKKLKHNLTGIMVRIILSFFTLKESDRFIPDIFVDEGYALSAHGFDARVLHLPGHSNGSIGVLTSEGDLLANRNRPAPGFGIFDTVEFGVSIEKLKALNVKIVYPGHGRPFPLAQFLRNDR